MAFKFILRGPAARRTAAAPRAPRRQHPPTHSRLQTGGRAPAAASPSPAAMSLFRVRERWAAPAGVGEAFSAGAAVACGALAGQGTVCLAAGSLDGVLRVWRPASAGRHAAAAAAQNAPAAGGGGARVDELLLEAELGSPVLQLLAGRFVVGGQGEALAVLHPRQLVVYQMLPADAAAGGAQHQQHQQAGGQHAGAPQSAAYYTLARQYEHKLERSAANMCAGRLGGGEWEGLVVQSMDGEIAVFECDVFAFRRFLPEYLLPGPLAFVGKTDTLVTANSRMEVQGFRYAQLLSAGEGKTAVGDAGGTHAALDAGGGAGIASTKKVVADWTTNVGECVLAMAVGNALPGHTQHARSPLVVAMGERTLFYLTERGALAAQRRLDFAPLSLGLARCAPTAHAGQARPFVNVLLGTDTGSVMVYHDATLAWAAKCDAPAVCLGAVRADLSPQADADGLAGMLYALDEQGRLTVGALGTRPPETVLAVAEGRELDYEEMDEEHRGLLQAIRESGANVESGPGGSGAGGSPAAGGAPLLQLRVQAPAGVEGAGADGWAGGAAQPRAASAKLFVTYAGQGVLERVTLTVRCAAPLRARLATVELNHVRGGARTPLVVPLTFEVDPALQAVDGAPPSSLCATVAASYDAPGVGPQVARADLTLPLALAAEVVPPVKAAEYKVTLDTNRPPPPLSELFADVLVASPAAGGAGANVLSFRLAAGGEATILVSKNAGRYRVQARSFEALALIADELCRRLKEHFGGGVGGSASMDGEAFEMGYEEPLPLQDYFALVDAHFEARARAAGGLATLERRAETARAVQRRLLVRYRDKNPSPLGSLDALLEDTLARLMSTGESIEVAQCDTVAAGRRLAAGTRLLLLLLRLRFRLSDEETAALACYLTAEVDDSLEQGWEETTDAALVHLLRTALAKGAREAGAGVAPLGGLPQDTTRLKKHVAVLCERLSKGGSLQALLE